MAISVIMIIISEIITISVDDNDCLCDDDNPLYISDLCYDDAFIVMMMTVCVICCGDYLCNDDAHLLMMMTIFVMMVTISVKMMMTISVIMMIICVPDTASRTSEDECKWY
jgi:hypothetical protein